MSNTSRRIRRDADAIAKVRDPEKAVDLGDLLRSPELIRPSARTLIEIGPKPETITDVRTDDRVFNPTRPRIITSTRVNSLPQFRELVRQKKRYPSRVRDLDRDFLRPKDWVMHRRETMVCAKRYIRKQILNALGKTGRGSGKRKKPRYNENSLVTCKRR